MSVFQLFLAKEDFFFFPVKKNHKATKLQMLKNETL